MIDAIMTIDSYVSGMEYEVFSRDRKTIDAVIRNLEVIGEASRHVPAQIRDRYSSLPWTEMSGMRNLLSHEYFGVDVSVVWKTVRSDLPPILPLLKEMLIEE